MLELRVERALGEDRRGVEAPDLVYELLRLLAGRLRLARERGDRGADYLEAVAGRVVAKCVVARHELALGRRELGDARLDALVERVELLLVCRRVRAVRRGVLRVGLREGVADRVHRRDPVARVLPPVGVGPASVDVVDEG